MFINRAENVGVAGRKTGNDPWRADFVRPPDMDFDALLLCDGLTAEIPAIQQLGRRRKVITAGSRESEVRSGQRDCEQPQPSMILLVEQQVRCAKVRRPIQCQHD